MFQQGKNPRYRFFFLLSLILFIISIIFMGPAVSQTIAAQVTLAWDTSSDTSVAGYKLYYGTASRTYGTPVDVGKVTQYTFTGIQEGAKAYFAVTAYDKTGNESAFSTELECFTLVPASVENGSISPSSTVVVSRGMNQTFTVAPASNYVISNVLVDTVSHGAVSTYTFSNIDSCHAISANFSAISGTYVVTASAGSGGAISPSGSIQVNYNSNKTFSITPSRNYSISDVIVDGVSIGAVKSYTFSKISNNHSISATFSSSSSSRSSRSSRSSGSSTISSRTSRIILRRSTALLSNNSSQLSSSSFSNLLSGNGGWINILTATGEQAAAPVHIDWPEYNALNGEIRVAAGDIDGGGKDKIIVGLGPVPGNPDIPGGYFAVLNDDESVLAWGKVEWPDYNSLNGETRPACGDIDGDGIDEIIIGLGPGGEGRLEIFKFVDDQLVHVKWLQTGWEDYNRLNGETRPACGDLDGNGTDEVIVGLGPVPGNPDIPGGVFFVFDPSAAGSTDLGNADQMDATGWGMVNWPDYNGLNGEIWPACGDVNNDGKDEIILGLGKQGAGRFEIVAFDPARNQTRHLAWQQSRISAGAEIRPACGRLESDAGDQIVIGFSKGGNGILQIFGNASENFEPIGQVHTQSDNVPKRGITVWPAILLN